MIASPPGLSSSLQSCRRPRGPRCSIAGWPAWRARTVPPCRACPAQPCRRRDTTRRRTRRRWAPTYQELPTGRDTTNGAAPPLVAINKVPVIPPGQRRAFGNITASLAVLREFSKFAPVIAMIDAGGEIGTLICELSEVFARLHLAQAHNVQDDDCLRSFATARPPRAGTGRKPRWCCRSG